MDNNTSAAVQKSPAKVIRDGLHYRVELDGVVIGRVWREPNVYHRGFGNMSWRWQQQAQRALNGSAGQGSTDTRKFAVLRLVSAYLHC